MKYSLMLRLWHWLNALTIFVLVGTALLRKTFFDTDTLIESIAKSTQEYGVNIDYEMAEVIAKAIHRPLWEWHIAFGYLLSFLLIFRVFIFVKEGVSYVDTVTIYNKLSTVIYTMFYSLTFFMVLSGLVLAQSDQLEASSFIFHDIKNLHDTAAWFFILFVPLHILSVVANSALKKNKSLSRMGIEH